MNIFKNRINNKKLNKYFMENTTNNKDQISKLKSDIKILADEQKYLKNQIKTVKLIGERTVEPWEAQYKHQRNRIKLRAMYVAYGLVRGKIFSEIENKYPEESHPLNKYSVHINKILNDYKFHELSKV